jgi:hypothetical protein
MTDERPWFRRKQFGVGFTPAGWPGWLITIAYVGIVIALDAALRAHHRAVEIAMIVVLTIGLFIIAAQHSERGAD